ncbi:MAG TPA: Holliday junction resolvase RuvX [bacterium]|jgi:putative Holliday junction resolvase|nr:Holliday junction resolvase RuvX [bacterium]HOG38068.1 Holliday junction resolvase RuvX [bacterium]HQI03124.1 Holliday junction resolvase RuvX [bacterium]
MKNYLGIDYGISKIGLALSDSETKVCLPYKILNEFEFWNSIQNIIEENNIDEVVLGIPKNLNNEETQQTQITMNFFEKLKNTINKKIHLEDERMTSKFANEIKKNIGMKNLGAEDDSSAALILDSFLKREYGN